MGDGVGLTSVRTVAVSAGRDVAFGATAAGAGGLVTSTLGNGAPIPSFDPQLGVTALVDHTTLVQANKSQYGVPILKQNTIEVQSSYSQAFSLGTNFTVTDFGFRQVDYPHPYSSDVDRELDTTANSRGGGLPKKRRLSRSKAREFHGINFRTFWTAPTKRDRILCDT